jgi:hypothetical protein
MELLGIDDAAGERLAAVGALEEWGAPVEAGTSDLPAVSRRRS